MGVPSECCSLNVKSSLWVCVFEHFIPDSDAVLGKLQNLRDVRSGWRGQLSDSNVDMEV